MHECYPGRGSIRMDFLGSFKIILVDLVHLLPFLLLPLGTPSYHLPHALTSPFQVALLSRESKLQVQKPHILAVTGSQVAIWDLKSLAALQPHNPKSQFQVAIKNFFPSAAALLFQVVDRPPQVAMTRSKHTLPTKAAAPALKKTREPTIKWAQQDIDLIVEWFCRRDEDGIPMQDDSIHRISAMQIPSTMIMSIDYDSNDPNLKRLPYLPQHPACPRLAFRVPVLSAAGLLLSFHSASSIVLVARKSV